MMSCLRLPVSFAPSSRAFFCRSVAGCCEAADMAKYREAFARRMGMAGIKPHHRIAVGVSGGADSMGLCVLAAGWKNDAAIWKDGNSGCIDGLLAIVVDHRLRLESTDEALRVRGMISRLGVRCEVASCDWGEDRPKKGHLQEAAREMRYQIFQDVCVKQEIGVLLVAHHADDQAELFILRLSRNSGVLGLAGMAFVSQLFPSYLCYAEGSSINPGLILVRPLLDFSKEDMYNICRGVDQEWVEDPTNQNPVFARNRIRMSLKSVGSCIFKLELQAVISECRKTRSYIYKKCRKLIDDSVTIMPHGYAVIDLKKLNASDVEDFCLSKFLAFILQFVSQRHRPIRSSVSNLLLNYIRNSPCKTSLTAAGCYLCAAPGSKGMKVLVCYSPDSTQPSRTEISHKFYFHAHSDTTTSEIESILAEAKLYSDFAVQQTEDLPFLHVSCPKSVLSEAKKLNLLSEASHQILIRMQVEESKHFLAETNLKDNGSLNYRTSSSPSSVREPLQSGHGCYFMDRFLVTWKMSETTIDGRSPMEINDFSLDLNEGTEACLSHCGIINHDVVAVLRLMIDDDWIYLSKLSKGHIPVDFSEDTTNRPWKMEKDMTRFSCSDFLQQSAERALQALKSIPVSARRSLPVLVDSQGLLLSIPSISFKCCPLMSVTAAFMPRVPLGGGFSSYI